ERAVRSPGHRPSSIWCAIRPGPHCANLLGDSRRPAEEPDDSVSKRGGNAGDVWHAQRWKRISTLDRSVRADLWGHNLLRNGRLPRKGEGHSPLAVQLPARSTDLVQPQCRPTGPFTG